MRLMPYEPVNFVSELSNVIDNIMNRNSNLDDSKVATSRWLPPVDIREEPDAFRISADLPGVDPKAIDIAMENNILTIKGTRNQEINDKKDNYFRMERSSGEFYRRFTLPNTADAEKIMARSKNGVLELTIPKKEVAQLRKIAIAVEE